VSAPCKDGRNDECIKAGFENPSLGATSLVIRKYGSCKKIILINY